MTMAVAVIVVVAVDEEVIEEVGFKAEESEVVDVVRVVLIVKVVFVL